MNNNAKQLWLLFVIFIQVCLIVLFITSGKNSYISIYRLKNVFNNTSTDYSGIFPKFKIYDNDKSYDILNIINNKNKSIIIIDGCICKDDSLMKWIKESKKHNIPVVYLYTTKKKFYNDKLASKNQNISVYLCSSIDILSFFKKEDIMDFPIAYTVDNNGIIISKER